MATLRLKPTQITTVHNCYYYQVQVKVDWSFYSVIKRYIVKITASFCEPHILLKHTFHVSLSRVATVNKEFKAHMPTANLNCFLIIFLRLDNGQCVIKWPIVNYFTFFLNTKVSTSTSKKMTNTKERVGDWKHVTMIHT